MKKATKDNNLIKIRFSVAPALFSTELSKIKSITGRRFDAVEKLWTIPLTVPNAKLLKSFGYELDAALRQMIGVEDKPMVCIRSPEPQKDFDESLLDILPHKLRPYQIQAVKFLEANDWRGCISLGMRMGKTIVSLCGTVIHPELSPCIIITTATGKGVWADEIDHWLKMQYVVLNGNTLYEIPDVPFIMVNYAIIPAWADYLVSLNPQYVILDEFHNVASTKLTVNKTKEEYNAEKAKNDKEGKPTKKQKQVPVQCTEAFLKLAAVCPHVVQLSGTPMTKCPRQLRVPLSVYVPQFKNEYWFLHRYCDPVHDGYGWKFDGLTNEQELFPILDKWMFRRTKQDIWSDLPNEQHQMISVDIDKDLYDKEMRSLKKELKCANLSDDEIEERLSKFESLSFSQKQSAIYTFIQEYLDTGSKLVVFAWHRTAMEAIYAKFKKCAIMIYGGTDPDDRKAFIKQFNEDDKTKLAVLQIKSCAEAITLKADTIAYAELPPTPGLLQQSAERIWIADGKQEKLFYYYFIAKGTVDKKRVDVLRSRAKLMNQTLDKSGESGVLFGQSLAEIVEEE